MSTKIYTGFRINTSDFVLIRKRVRAFRKKVILPLANKMFDAFVEHGTDEERSARYKEWRDRRRVVETTMQRDPVVDTQFSLVFFPRKNDCLGMSFSDHSDWHDLWIKSPGVSEYMYYNNTDEPEGLSRKAWKLREKAWDEVFAGNSTPSMSGFTIDLVHEYEPWPKHLRNQDVI
jgi:hypothetical protein